MSRKKILIRAFYYLLTFTIVLSIIIYRLFFSIQAVPQGELMRTVESPNGNYAIRTYFCYGGSLSADASRGELVNLKKGKAFNIYWNYPDADPYVIWLNNEQVTIGNQTLDISQGEIYDWRDDPNWVRWFPKQFPK